AVCIVVSKDGFAILRVLLFLCQLSGTPRVLRSFPTRRSSDLSAGERLVVFAVRLLEQPHQFLLVAGELAVLRRKGANRTLLLEEPREDPVPFGGIRRVLEVDVVGRVAAGSRDGGLRLALRAHEGRDDGDDEHTEDDGE